MHRITSRHVIFTEHHYLKIYITNYQLIYFIQDLFQLFNQNHFLLILNPAYAITPAKDQQIETQLEMKVRCF